MLPAKEIHNSRTSKKESMDGDGYAVFREIFSADDIGELREECFRILPKQYPPFSAQSVSQVLDKNKLLREKILGNQRLIGALAEVLGDDFLLIDEHGLQDSSYAKPHADTTSPERRGYKFHLNDEFLVIQWAIYLQDNGPNGGGLSVVPQSHKYPDIYAEPLRFANAEFRLNRMLRRTLNRTIYRVIGLSLPIRASLQILKILRLTSDFVFGLWQRHSSSPNKKYVAELKESYVKVESKAGDVVCFNLRLWHAATPAGQCPESQSSRKLAIFFVAGRNNWFTGAYKEWLNLYHDERYLGKHKPSDDFLQWLDKKNIKLL
jgi:hypothetical protein